jgi:hypothetical protein
MRSVDLEVGWAHITGMPDEKKRWSQEIIRIIVALNLSPTGLCLASLSMINRWRGCHMRIVALGQRMTSFTHCDSTVVSVGYVIGVLKSGHMATNVLP